MTIDQVQEVAVIVQDIQNIYGMSVTIKFKVNSADYGEKTLSPR